jgi:hypothetical protein
MPQVTGALIIKDGSATPANVSYGPEVMSSQRAVFVDRRLPSRDQQPSIERTFGAPEKGVRTQYAVSDLIRYPIVRTVAGVDSVVAVAEAHVKYRLPTVATQQERKHLRALAANAQDIAILIAGPEDLDPLY